MHLEVEEGGEGKGKGGNEEGSWGKIWEGKKEERPLEQIDETA